MKQKTKPGLIHADKLCELTGLTDMRHRQLAKAGYFPNPIRAEYELTRTIQGLFRYYREQAQESPIDAKRLEKLTKENALLDVELARAQKSMIDTETVARVWENLAAGIRRVVLLSPLPEADKKKICNELATVTRESYVEQRRFDEGTA